MQRGNDDADAADGADIAALNGDYDDGDAPAFEGREPGGHALPAPANGAGEAARGPLARLSADEKERLQMTLSELLELKRLLDQSR